MLDDSVPCHQENNNFPKILTEWISTSIYLVTTGPNSHLSSKGNWETCIFFFFCPKQIQSPIGKKYREDLIGKDIGWTTCVCLKL